MAVAKDVLAIYGAEQVSWEDIIEHSSNLYSRTMFVHNLLLILPPIITYAIQQMTTGNRRLLQGVRELYVPHSIHPVRIMFNFSH